MKLAQLLAQLRATPPVEATRYVIVETLRRCEESDGATARLVRLSPDLVRQMQAGQSPGEDWPPTFAGVPLEVVKLPPCVLCEVITARGSLAQIEF